MLLKDRVMFSKMRTSFVKHDLRPKRAALVIFSTIVNRSDFGPTQQDLDVKYDKKSRRNPTKLTLSSYLTFVITFLFIYSNLGRIFDDCEIFNDISRIFNFWQRKFNDQFTTVTMLLPSYIRQ